MASLSVCEPTSPPPLSSSRIAFAILALVLLKAGQSLGQTQSPTHLPSPATNAPTTFAPSIIPTLEPSSIPTHLPTLFPSINPTFSPSTNPTTFPSQLPTRPTQSPTTAPTIPPASEDVVGEIYSYYMETSLALGTLPQSYTYQIFSPVNVSLSYDGNLLATSFQYNYGFSSAQAPIAQVYTRSETSASFSAPTNIQTTDPSYSSILPCACSLSGNKEYFVIGYPQFFGGVFPFQKVQNQTKWDQISSGILTGAGYVYSTSTSYTYPMQGTSVALSSTGGFMAVGGPGDNYNIGAVWIFYLVNEQYQPFGQKIVGSGYSSGTTPYMGYSVAIGEYLDTPIVCFGGYVLYSFTHCGFYLCHITVFIFKK